MNLRILTASCLLAAVCFGISCAKKETSKQEVKKEMKVGPVQLDPRAALPILNKARNAAKKAEDRAEDHKKQLDQIQ